MCCGPRRRRGEHLRGVMAADGSARLLLVDGRVVDALVSFDQPANTWRIRVDNKEQHVNPDELKLSISAPPRRTVTLDGLALART